VQSGNAPHDFCHLVGCAFEDSHYLSDDFTCKRRQNLLGEEYIINHKSAICYFVSREGKIKSGIDIGSQRSLIQLIAALEKHKKWIKEHGGKHEETSD
jgi:hypothetical protein